MKLTEAFRALNALNEDTFSVSDDGISKLAEFEQNDDLADDISVIDPEAETEEDLEDSYVGKIILDCTVCHSKLYKDIEEIELDEDQTLANVGEECPYCYTSDGFKVLGQVSAFGGKTEESEDGADATDTDDDAKPVDTDDDKDDDVVEESLSETLAEGIFGPSKKKKAQMQREREEREYQEQQKQREQDSQAWQDWCDQANANAAANKQRQEAERRAQADMRRADRERISKYSTGGGNTGHSGVHYSGGDYWESLEEAAAGTLERPMSAIGGTLSNVMADHSDELANVYDKVSAISFLDAIEPEVKNKGYLQSIKEKISRLPDSRATQFLYNIILKGDGMGAKLEAMDEGIFDRFRKKDSNTDSDSNESTPAVKEVGSKMYKGIRYLIMSDGSYRLIDSRGRTKPQVYKSFDTIKDIIDREVNESLNEDVNNVNVETDDSIVNVATDDSGKVTVTTEPKAADVDVQDGAEVITPLTDENEAAILDAPVDEPAEDEFTDVELDEFDDETFDGLGESYLKKVYENVQSYKTTDCAMKDDKIMLEGVITFNSGAKKKTSFIFEAKDFTKSGKYRFIGENQQLTRGKKAFTLKGRIDEGKFITESFNYNYKAKDTAGNSTRIYGTIKG